MRKMRTSTEGIALIQHFEDLRLDAYRCAAGVWTIGWGHTGPDVRPGMRITRERADELLAQDLAQFERDVASLVTVELRQCQFDALVSFAFNVGSDIDDDDIAEGLGDSTLLRLVNASDFTRAQGEFRKWVYSRGKVLRGLVRRRAAEAAMFGGASAAQAIRIGKEAA